MLQDFIDRTGHFKTDEHGNIPGVNPAITEFMNEFVKTIDTTIPL